MTRRQTPIAALRWLAILAFSTACAGTGLVVPEALDHIEPLSIEPADATLTTDLRAGNFNTHALESAGEGQPFTFTLREGDIPRARIRCIWSQAFVCTGDEAFSFFVRIQKGTEEQPAPVGELTVETVNFELRPSIRPPDLSGESIVGYELHGPKDVLAALQTRAPGARVWLTPKLAASLRRAIFATAFALRFRALLIPAPPPEP